MYDAAGPKFQKKHCLLVKCPKGTYLKLFSLFCGIIISSACQLWHC